MESSRGNFLDHMRWGSVMAVLLLSSPGVSYVATRTAPMNVRRSPTTTATRMVMNPPADMFVNDANNYSRDEQKKRLKRKYQRKRIPDTEKEARKLRKERQKEYEKLISKAENGSQSIWRFESLFPEPILDTDMIDKDLYEVKRRDAKTSGRNSGETRKSFSSSTSKPKQMMRNSFYGGNSMLRIWREARTSSAFLPLADHNQPEVLASMAVP